MAYEVFQKKRNPALTENLEKMWQSFRKCNETRLKVEHFSSPYNLQFVYINEIIYQLINILSSMPNPK